MIMRDSNGDLIEINILEFLTDNEYYKKVLEIKDIHLEDK